MVRASSCVAGVALLGGVLLLSLLLMSDSPVEVRLPQTKKVPFPALGEVRFPNPREVPSRGATRFRFGDRETRRMGSNLFDVRAASLKLAGGETRAVALGDEEALLVVADGRVECRGRTKEDMPFGAVAFVPSGSKLNLTAAQGEGAAVLVLKWRVTNHNPPSLVPKVLVRNAHGTAAHGSVVLSATRYLTHFVSRVAILEPGETVREQKNAFDVAVLVLRGTVSVSGALAAKSAVAPMVLFYPRFHEHGLQNVGSAPAYLLVLEFQERLDLPLAAPLDVLLDYTRADMSAVVDLRTVHASWRWSENVDVSLMVVGAVLKQGTLPHPLHTHMQEEVLFVLDGLLESQSRDSESDPAVRKTEVRGGQAFFHPAQSLHTIRALKETQLLLFKLQTTRLRENVESSRRAIRIFDFWSVPLAHDMVEEVFCEETRYLQKLCVKLVHLEPGREFAAHADPYDVSFLVLNGTVQVLGHFKKQAAAVAPRHPFFHFPKGAAHGMKNVGQTRALVVAVELHGRVGKEML